MAILLGVDTGGTYTDAVIWDEAAGRVLGKAKALTTHRDLAAGIGAAMDAALRAAQVPPSAVSLVSLSTTLATNALVEGHGDPAALVLIGFSSGDLARAGLGEALGREPSLLVAGGHRSDGGEAAPLDEAALRAGLREAAPHVSAVAIASVFAVRNPAHENRAREIAREETGLPVTASHELSAKLGGPRRALTTLLNARLVGMIDRLIRAAEGLLAARGIAAPLMVVKGDGALMGAAIARARPIETILSGPAASLVGAAKLTGLSRALVSDIGGTTTDIAAIVGGRPRIDPEGAKVGPWRTMVEAAAMRTHGLGGDSEVSLDDAGFAARLRLGPRRAVPVSLFAKTRPEAREALARQLARPRHEAGDGVFLAPGARAAGRDALPAEEAALLAAVGEGAAIDALKGGPKARAALERLVAEGFLRRVAFTPSDAAHVLGLHAGWDGAAAEMAAALFSRRKGNDGRPVAANGAALSRMVVDALTRRSAELALEAALAEDGMEAEGLAASPLGAAALNGREGFARPRLTLTIPLIGLGASAPVYYPEVARLAGAEAAIPDHADVANAVGAVAGRVEARAEALILSPDGDMFDLMTPEGPRRFATLDAARAAAEAMARAAALEAALAAGAEAPEVALRWEEKRATVEAREMLAEARAVALASGRPRF
ncbi:MAG: hydantoinase/oxoprolinase N-terminal domain-containing protein [Pikeienuella sp.]|uniref:hydantoinase/oxoprolinase N-terminal domain-containing protein n=1 Tax=Pikeienuella sp. TaxID=2831957 RepID=UPI0039194952